MSLFKETVMAKDHEHIYLIDMGDPEEIVWCNSPDPGIGMDKDDAVQYIRHDVAVDELAKVIQMMVSLRNINAFPDKERAPLYRTVDLWLKEHAPAMQWICKNCGENETPSCPKCVREDGKLVTDELVED